MSNQNGSENRDAGRTIYMGLGLTVGVAIGAAMDNIAVGMCIGLAIGLCIGTVLDIRKIKKCQKESQEQKTDEE